VYKRRDREEKMKRLVTIADVSTEEGARDTG
jgi:hypothetical protein